MGGWESERLRRIPLMFMTHRKNKLRRPLRMRLLQLRTLVAGTRSVNDPGLPRPTTVPSGRPQSALRADSTSPEGLALRRRVCALRSRDADVLVHSLAQETRRAETRALVLKRVPALHAGPLVRAAPGARGELPASDG